MIRLSASRAVLVALLCALTLLSTRAMPSDLSDGLSGTLRTTYFTIRFDADDPYLARLIADAARNEMIRVSKDLGYRPEPGRPFQLNVYRSHYEFLRGQKLQGSKFTVGIAMSGNQAISIDASGTLVLPETALAHEITHAVIFRMLGPKVNALPLWLNEGLAKYESDDFTRADGTTVANAAAEGSLIRLALLEDNFPEDRTDLAYAESALAVKYLVRKHGKSAPKVLMRELARTGSFDEAMKKATGRAGDVFAGEWYASATREYLAYRIVRVVLATVSALMAVLAILAFLARRKQKIEAARRWELEEFDEAIRRQQGNDWSR
ncbi:MAG: peptidase MA family metallohydrolase [Armatimonadetes bacterium]|nr:peptidase MA family metallohydrolase [Armatimonadota bacterium]